MEKEKKVKDIIANVLGIAPEEINMNADWYYDLGGDSLAHVEAVIEMENEFDISITDEQSEKLRKVSDFVDIVSK